MRRASMASVLVRASTAWLSRAMPTEDPYLTSCHVDDTFVACDVADLDPLLEYLGRNEPAAGPLELPVPRVPPLTGLPPALGVTGDLMRCRTRWNSGSRDLAARPMIA